MVCNVKLGAIQGAREECAELPGMYGQLLFLHYGKLMLDLKKKKCISNFSAAIPEIAAIVLQ